jgi:hypothetical protein
MILWSNEEGIGGGFHGLLLSALCRLFQLRFNGVPILDEKHHRSDIERVF